jgi:hypothetical protein
VIAGCRRGQRAGFAIIASVAVLLTSSVQTEAQRGRGAQPPATARAAAPIDLTGYWVSIVAEDWIWRMTTPQKGDIGSGPTGGFLPIPLSAEGRRVTLAWDPAKDEAEGAQCKSYGAGNIMNVPGRFHFTWADDNTLQLDVDAGMQTRLFHFVGSKPANLQPSWQGYSAATWDGVPDFERTHWGTPEGRGQLITQTFGEGGGSRGGNLKVRTTDLRAGYLRKNGVPYSDKAVLEEHFRVFTEPNGDVWLITTSLIDDPQYLSEPFLVSRTFKKEPNGAKWSPSPCAAR